MHESEDIKTLSLSQLQTIMSHIPGILDWNAGVLYNRSQKSESMYKWIKEGKYGGLQYMADTVEQRIHPKLEHPWARSVLIYLFPYPEKWNFQEPYLPKKRTLVPDQKSKGPKIARYAQGPDYHFVAQRVNGTLGQSLQNLFATDLRWKAFSDSYPLWERDLAAELGLGFRAKNTCLIHPRWGSGFFIAGLILECELEFLESSSSKVLSVNNLNAGHLNPKGSGHPPLPSCGSCQLCIDACPTKALKAPGVLDAGLCISTWTIEKKEQIPPSIAEKLSGWVFGCDICQEVCPWNHKNEERQGVKVTEFWNSFAQANTDSTSTIAPKNSTSKNFTSKKSTHIVLPLAQLDTLSKAGHTAVNTRKVILPQEPSKLLQLCSSGGGLQKLIRGTALMRAGRKKILRNILVDYQNTLKKQNIQKPLDPFVQDLKKGLDFVLNKESDETILLLASRIKKMIGEMECLTQIFPKV